MLIRNRSPEREQPFLMKIGSLGIGCFFHYNAELEHNLRYSAIAIPFFLRASIQIHVIFNNLELHINLATVNNGHFFCTSLEVYINFPPKLTCFWEFLKSAFLKSRMPWFWTSVSVSLSGAVFWLSTQDIIVPMLVLPWHSGSLYSVRFQLILIRIRWNMTISKNLNLSLQELTERLTSNNFVICRICYINYNSKIIKF